MKKVAKKERVNRMDITTQTFLPLGGMRPVALSTFSPLTAAVAGAGTGEAVLVAPGRERCAKQNKTN